MADRAVSRLAPAIIAGVVLFLDVVTKFLTHQYLPLVGGGAVLYPYSGVAVFQNFLGVEFSISHTINKGAAWGVFADMQHLLLVFRLCLIVCLAAYLTFFCIDRRRMLPLAIVLAGAVGNVIDHFIYGHVVDMFHFVLWGYDFPVFNVADSAITVGIAWLLVLSLLKEESISEGDMSGSASVPQ